MFVIREEILIMQNKLAAERRREILLTLKAEKKVIVSNLAKKYKVTTATIRRDLDYLGENYKIQRVHSGAIMPEIATTFEPIYSEKTIINSTLKKEIGIVASGLIHDGDSLFIDSGTTAFQLAENLGNKSNLKIITTDLKIGCLLSANTDFEVVLVGGKVRTNQFNCIGPISEQIISHLNVDLFFMAVDGLDLKKGITITNFEEAAIKKMMLQNSSKTIVLADHSKFSRVSLCNVCSISEIDILITDNFADRNPIREIEEMGILVLQA